MRPRVGLFATMGGALLSGCAALVSVDDVTYVDGGGADGFTDAQGSDSEPTDGGAEDRGLSTALSVGIGHSCALRNGKVYCWGNGADIGATTGCDASICRTPAPVVLPDQAKIASFVQVAASGAHTCAVTADAAVHCWGDDGYGQLGRGTSPPPDSTRALVPAPVRQIVVGQGHTCALDQDGAVWCWGDGRRGQLGFDVGDAGTTQTPTKASVAGVVQLSSGGAFTCAKLGDGGVVCWGESNDFATGVPCDGGTCSDWHPSQVPGLDGTVVRIACGGAAACALMAGGSVRCWGNAMALGDGTTDSNRAVAGDVLDRTGAPLSGVVSLALGKLTGCASMGGDGGVYCWGSNDHDVIVGPPLQYATPMPDITAAGFQELVMGDDDNCGIRPDGGVACRGYDNAGQIGPGCTTATCGLTDIPLP
jgi:alpha-tubulin suppressor-like RCC1 family protein